MKICKLKFLNTLLKIHISNKSSDLFCKTEEQNLEKNTTQKPLFEFVSVEVWSLLTKIESKVTF